MPEGHADYSQWFGFRNEVGEPLGIRSVEIDIGPDDLTFRKLSGYRLEVSLTRKAQKRLTNILRTEENRYRRAYRRKARRREKMRRERLKACANSVNQ